MRFLNMVGNKLSLAFSWLLGQPINDTLAAPRYCGNVITKKLPGIAPISEISTFWGFRSLVRSDQTQPENCGNADSIPIAVLRRYQY